MRKCLCGLESKAPKTWSFEEEYASMYENWMIHPEESWRREHYYEYLQFAEKCREKSREDLAFLVCKRLLPYSQSS